MKRSAGKQRFIFLRAALVLFIVLLAVYIPLKIHIARSDVGESSTLDGQSLSIFVTNELRGYREPCG